jgi:hypothetical protein
MDVKIQKEKNHSSSVIIVTGYGLNDRSVIPGRDRDFSVLHRVQTGSSASRWRQQVIISQHYTTSQLRNHDLNLHRRENLETCNLSVSKSEEVAG